MPNINGYGSGYQYHSFTLNQNEKAQERGMTPQWESHHVQHSGYKSPCDYIFDTAVRQRQEHVTQYHEGPEYSQLDKSFYGVVPSNTQSFLYEPVFGRFDISRLPQTNVLNVLTANKANLIGTNKVSLAQVIKPLIPKMGNIQDNNGECVGTCTLISDNLVMVARHIIENMDIQNLKVTFGQVKKFDGLHEFANTELDYVVEDDPCCDYAIVKLKHSVGSRLGYVRLNTQDELLSESALLHYPLGNPLKISVHTFDQTDSQSIYLKTFHDSDYSSSGGAYFDSLGRFTAMHLGIELEGDKVNVCRSAITLQEIVNRNPGSILSKFASGQLSQAQSYSSNMPKYCLEQYLPSPFITWEGIQSKKILTGLLKDQINKRSKKYDAKVKLTNTGVALSKSNLAYIKKTYPNKFENLLRECLNVTGIHKFTKEYSILGYIESDHTIPHAVWKATTNQKMNDLINGRGARPGENNLPAITIPYTNHRHLRTTGSSDRAKKFREKLINLCNEDKIVEVLLRCFKEYTKNGIDLKNHKVTVVKSLEEYSNLDLIDNIQKKNIIFELFKK